MQWTPYDIATDQGNVAGQLGKIKVPERRGADGTRSITIAFARIPSTSPNPGAPIIYLDGGPGGSGVGAARIPAYGALFRALRSQADVILLSQRGTGLSDRIGCRSTTPLPAGTLTTLAAMEAEVAVRHRDCAGTLRAQGVDLAGYTTRESADDVEAVRQALGVPKISLIGFSYGTHLGLAVLRQHGARVERAVLLGTEGPGDTWKLPATYDRQVAAIAALVKADPAAAAAMPDVEGALRQLIAQTTASPIRVTARIGERERTMDVGAAAILYLLRRDIGDTNDVPWIPAFIYETLAGNYEQLQRLLARRVPAVESGVQMMATAMDCASAASAARLARIEREKAQSIFGGLANFPFPSVCAAAGIAPLDEAFRRPVASQVPTLFVSGTLDSNTPPAQAEEVMRGFPNGRHLVVQGAGHESTLTPQVAAHIVEFLSGKDVASARLPGPILKVELPGGGR